MISLLLTLGGLVLLALDRTLPKDRVAAFDEKLANFCRNFRPIGMNVYRPALFVVMVIAFLSIAPSIRRMLPVGHPIPDETMLFVTRHPRFVIVLAWLTIVPVYFFVRLIRMGKYFFIKRFGSSDRTPTAEETFRNYYLDKGLLFNLVLVPMVGLLFVPFVGVIGVSHLALMPFVYPLKPLLLFNGRIFTSFSGVVGLIAAVTGAVLQFRGC